MQFGSAFVLVLMAGSTVSLCLRHSQLKVISLREAYKTTVPGTSVVGRQTKQHESESDSVRDLRPSTTTKNHKHP